MGPPEDVGVTVLPNIFYMTYCIFKHETHLCTVIMFNFMLSFYFSQNKTALLWLKQDSLCGNFETCHLASHSAS